jgi:hypothetical protein
MHRRRKVQKEDNMHRQRRIKLTEDKEREESERIKHDRRMTTHIPEIEEQQKATCRRKSNLNNQLAKESMHCNGVFLG